MDAITLLKDDHKTVEKLFKRFEKAGDRAYVEKRDVTDRIIEELSKHAAIEELIFYPVTRETVPQTDDIVLESLEEHHIVKWVLAELEKMEPEDERFDAKVTVLIENVRHHVKEEEQDYFPKVRDELGRKALGELGDAMVAAKATAPTHPHPRSPDVPPGNVVAGNAAGVVDKVADTVSGLAQGGVAVAQDVVARVMGSKKPTKAPKGNSVAKKTAAKVRATAADAAGSVADATKEAKRTGKASTDKAVATVRATGKAAESGAKATATTAKKGAKATSASAKRTRTTATNAAAKAASTTQASAKRSVNKATKAASSSAKATVTTAKKSAKATKTTAKRAATTTARAAKS